MEVRFESPTWSKIYRLMLSLGRQIVSADFEPDVVVGISRGGWLPARVLSDLLTNPNLASVKAECYVRIGEAKETPMITQRLMVDVTGKAVLVVDDVADTGKSLRLVKTHVLEQEASEVKTATLYYKRRSIFKPDFYAKETDCWIVFPWELKETVNKILEAHRKNPAGAQKELEKLAMSGVPKRLITRFEKEFSEERIC